MNLKIARNSQDLQGRLPAYFLPDCVLCVDSSGNPEENVQSWTCKNIVGKRKLKLEIYFRCFNRISIRQKRWIPEPFENLRETAGVSC